MKKTNKTPFFFLLAVTCGMFILMVMSCNVFKSNHTPQYSVDPVCNMKVDKSEAYTYKYKGIEYFFDSKNCKETFKMNPEKFIKN